MLEKNKILPMNFIREYKSIGRFIIVVIVMVLLNLLSINNFFRVDLTTEKRHTLSKQTKEIIKKLDEPVYFHVYLDGDLPIGLKKLQRACLEMLDEFKAYGKRNVKYRLINPYENKNEGLRNGLFNELASKGIQPTEISTRDQEGGASQKLVFPGAIVTYSGKEIIINLLDNNPGLSADENLNRSMEGLEYKFIEAVNRIIHEKSKKIAFIEGHGELDEYSTADITKELSKYYNIDRVRIDGNEGILDDYNLVIIAKPISPISEKDKFVIDQYIMNGGKTFWLLDAVRVFADSLAKYGNTIGFLNDINIDDQLFKYGVRINPVLVQDIQCAIIPVNTALPGNPSKFMPAPWLYHPLLNSSPEHPATKNLNLIKAEYISYIDTVGEYSDRSVDVLLRSSRMTRTINFPALISLSEVAESQDKSSFNKNYLPLGVIIEGQFESVFKNRMIKGLTKNESSYKVNSKETMMLVIADGDIIRNNVRQRPDGKLIEPLGYDRYTKQTFGNKEFLVNLVNYFVDESGLINLRGRSLELRLLDKQKIADSKFTIQMYNVVLPILIVVLFGILFNYYRKKKYAR